MLPCRHAYYHFTYHPLILSPTTFPHPPPTSHSLSLAALLAILASRLGEAKDAFVVLEGVTSPLQSLVALVRHRALHSCSILSFPSTHPHLTPSFPTSRISLVLRLIRRCMSSTQGLPAQCRPPNLYEGGGSVVYRILPEQFPTIINLNLFLERVFQIIFLSDSHIFSHS